jgi:hypothetical protein
LSLLHDHMMLIKQFIALSAVPQLWFSPLLQSHPSHLHAKPRTRTLLGRPSTTGWQISLDLATSASETLISWISRMRVCPGRRNNGGDRYKTLMPHCGRLPSTWEMTPIRFPPAILVYCIFSSAMYLPLKHYSVHCLFIILSCIIVTAVVMWSL